MANSSLSQVSNEAEEQSVSAEHRAADVAVPWTTYQLVRSEALHLAVHTSSYASIHDTLSLTTIHIANHPNDYRKQPSHDESKMVAFKDCCAAAAAAM
jgi:hypothetical protein